jgi:hypothetical protein
VSAPALDIDDAAEPAALGSYPGKERFTLFTVVGVVDKRNVTNVTNVTSYSIYMKSTEKM